MGIIVWAILGLAAGIIARILIPGGNPQRSVIATLIGIAGTFLGGFAAARLFMVEGAQGFFDLSTWVTALMGAAGMLFFLLTYRLLLRHKRSATPHPLDRPRVTRLSHHRPRGAAGEESDM
jgi:uncharacterized membrane protein YeaQ/YmgE (transglycosylase-associated protein family)